MPITLKPNAVKYKDPITGNYVNVDVMGEKITYDAEAYAKGTRNGIAVSSTEPGYQDNSKYYAEQAQEILNSIPEDYSSLVSDVSSLRDDLDQNIENLIDDISQISKTGVNLFDIKKLKTKPNITVDGDTFSALPHTLYTYGDIYGVEYEAGQQYTVSLQAKTTSALTNNGLGVYAFYTDNTSSLLFQFSNSQSTYLYKYGTTTAGKTVSRIVIAYSNNSKTIWDIKQFQIEKGNAASGYVPYSLNIFNPRAIQSSELIITAGNMESTYSDCDDLPVNSIVSVHTNAISAGFAHLPTANGICIVSFTNNTQGHFFQLGLPFNYATKKIMYIRVMVNNVWSEWVTINNDPLYTGYDIFPDGTLNNRGPEIEGILVAKNICRLAPGDYYIDKIDINANKSIEGCGNNTRLIKTSNPTSNYMVSLSVDAKIKNLAIYGSLTDIIPSSEWELASSVPCGIKIQGTGSSDSQRFRCEVENVRISSIAGTGIYISGTGYNPQGGCYINNIFVRNCNAGIALGKIAEFHRISGSGFFENYYGAINNGGNNVFVNCDFSTNMHGVLMDNSSGNYNNNSHGAFVGCTINHTGSKDYDSGRRGDGYALDINAMGAGEIFNGCSIFYGKIKLASSQGIILSNCNFGSYTPIFIENGGGIQFANCVFRVGHSTVTDNRPEKTHFDSCYYLNGTPVDNTPS